MFPELIRLPVIGQAIHTYGVVIAAGFVLSSHYIARDARLAGEKRPAVFTDLAFYCLLIGLFGSRLLYIAVNWKTYAKAPIELLYVWRGGLVFYGGFLSALMFALWWCKHNGHAFFKVADRLIPGVALTHAFGRIGCLAAGCCFGAPTALAIGIVYPDASAVHHQQATAGLIHPLARALPVHPAPVYEATGELVLFALLVWLRPRKRYDGQLLLVWLALYPILRSAVEITRGDSERGFLVPGLISTSQAISLFVAGLAGVLFFRLRGSR